MNDVSLFIDKEKIKSVEKGKIYNSLEESVSSEFYAELFSEATETAAKPELYESLKQKHKGTGIANKIMEEIVGFLEKELPEDSILIEIGGGVSQSRSADAYKRFKNYFPLDISQTSISRYSDAYDKVGFIADAEELPFTDASIDCIFTHTFLEHPIRPEKVVAEIVRVLKPGGIIVHNDAWFCRWWQRYGVVGLKSVSNMSFKEKMVWLGSRITEFPLFRIPPIILRRLFRELLISTKSEIPLVYQKLEPNYNLHLGCDEDAASSLDPVNVIRYYESRGFSLIRPLSFKQRLFHPNKYIMLRKGKA